MHTPNLQQIIIDVTEAMGAHVTRVGSVSRTQEGGWLLDGWGFSGLPVVSSYDQSWLGRVEAALNAALEKHGSLCLTPRE